MVDSWFDFAAAAATTILECITCRSIKNRLEANSKKDKFQSRSSLCHSRQNSSSQSNNKDFRVVELCAVQLHHLKEERDQV